MQILVCDDNPYMVNRLFDLIQHQISLQGIFCSYVPTCLAFEQLCTANCCYQYEFLGMEYSLLGHQCGHISGTSILLRT